jgi:hypothetical protein
VKNVRRLKRFETIKLFFQEISKEIHEEEIRLEKRMLAEREEAIKVENKKRDKMAKLCFNHYQDIKAQLDARENLRKAEATRIKSKNRVVKS